MSEKNPWFESGHPARPTDIKADKADLDMRLERKALAEGWDRTADKLDATQSELAALREELADETRRANVNALNARHAKQDLNTIQHRLTAAEQRNSDLIDLIQKAHTWVDRNNCGGWDAYELRDELAAAMNKPTESGASE